MNLNQERLDALNNFKLSMGSHASLEQGACIMEMVSYVANEKWSDHPECACPILTQLAIRLNDRFKDEHRELLKPLIPLLIGTRADDATQIARKRFILWRNVTATYPLILDMIKLPEFAEKLRTLPNSIKGMNEAAAFLKANKEKIYAHADANANAYAHAYAYADANAYAYANAHADAYADAYANAHADANADAYALREKIALTAVETLRLAIAVTK